ncbi:MAG: hypothetical protein J6K48_06850 [Lachnospiraceae bacterium]|nr:hypothetical protein [Lachnospiraceae bacterium]
MRNFLTVTKMRMSLAMRNFVDSFKEERGDTNFVAIIVIIVIIMAIAVIFQDKLTEAVNRVFDNLMNFIG